MTREEERNKAAFEAYPAKISYSTVIEQNVDYNRESREIWLQGALWADKTMINKVCKWLKERMNDNELKDVFETVFRKAMEEGL